MEEGGHWEGKDEGKDRENNEGRDGKDGRKVRLNVK